MVQGAGTDIDAPKVINAQKYFDGTKELDLAIYERRSLSSGAEISGPALVVEDQTTTLIPPGARARSLGGHLEIVIDE